MISKETFIERKISKIKKKIFILDNNGYINFLDDNFVICFRQDLKNKILWVNYFAIWLILHKYDMNDTEIQLLIKEMAEKHLKIKGFTILCRHYFFP